jgi:hypothetical protein
VSTISDDNAAIKEFHASAKRRRRNIMLVAGAACVAIGIAILVVTFFAEQGAGKGGKFETKTLVFGGGFLIAGVGAFVKALDGE